MNALMSSELYPAFNPIQCYFRVAKLAFSAVLAGIALLTPGAASAQTMFQAKIIGHITPHALCPYGVQICGVATIVGFNAPAEYRWSVTSTSPPTKSCGSFTAWLDYGATATLTLPDGSKLTVDETGTACYPGNSFPTGGLSWGNPRTVLGKWTVQSARGQFSGISGNGTDTGRTVGGVFLFTYISDQ